MSDECLLVPLTPKRLSGTSYTDIGPSQSGCLWSTFGCSTNKIKRLPDNSMLAADSNL